MALIRVMVAEDMPLLREDLADIVNRQEDMELVGEADSGQAIRALAEETDCDVILMDIEMETMQAGIAAAEAIHAAKPEIKIILLTAHETEEMIVSGMDTGAVDYVVKGSDDDVLLEHIRNAYHGTTTLEPRIQQTVMREYDRLRRSERSLLFFIHNVARLTPAEREMVKLLLAGKKIPEIARLRCVEMVTVKTQIKSLLNKFGCSRSKEIVQMIHSLGLEHLFQ